MQHNQGPPDKCLPLSLVFAALFTNRPIAASKLINGSCDCLSDIFVHALFLLIDIKMK